MRLMLTWIMIETPAAAHYQRLTLAKEISSSQLGTNEL